LLQDPELQPVGKTAGAPLEDTEELPQSDISDEANIKIEPNGTIEGAVAPNEPDILHKIKKQTDETLKKGNAKDEK
jgi:hypothetical protein